MLLRNPQNTGTFVPDSVNALDIISIINLHIESSNCEFLSVDISFMNIIDSCYIVTICSTKHFSKYPNGCIDWHVSSGEIKDLNKDFDLGNCRYLF